MKLNKFLVAAAAVAVLPLSVANAADPEGDAWEKAANEALKKETQLDTPTAKEGKAAFCHSSQ